MLQRQFTVNSMEADPKDWIRGRKTGSLLLLSPSYGARANSLREFAKQALCRSDFWIRNCDCASCTAVDTETHPELIRATPETFDQVIREVVSLPTPVVQFSEVHRVPFRKQTKLLIWLETFHRSRFVMLSAESEGKLLPTIKSRSVVFVRIPREGLSDEERFKAITFMQSLWSGQHRLESVNTEEDAIKIASAMRSIAVDELQNRFTTPGKRTFPASDADLQIFLKLLERYFSNPKTHNLKLLLSGFSAHVLQGIR